MVRRGPAASPWLGARAPARWRAPRTLRRAEVGRGARCDPGRNRRAHRRHCGAPSGGGRRSRCSAHSGADRQYREVSEMSGIASPCLGECREVDVVLDREGDLTCRASLGTSSNPSHSTLARSSRGATQGRSSPERRWPGRELGSERSFAMRRSVETMARSVSNGRPSPWVGRHVPFQDAAPEIGERPRQSVPPRSTASTDPACRLRTGAQAVDPGRWSSVALRPRLPPRPAVPRSVPRSRGPGRARGRSRAASSAPVRGSDRGPGTR